MYCQPNNLKVSFRMVGTPNETTSYLVDKVLKPTNKML